MPLFEWIFSAILGLLFGSLVTAVPVFFLILLAAFLRKKLAKIYGLNWIVSAIIITFLFSLIFIVFVYFFPVISSIPEETIGKIPSVLQPTEQEWFLFWFYVIFKILAVALIVSVALMPFILIGSFIFEQFNASKRFKKFPSSARLFLAIYLTLIVLFALLLHVFYWIVFGLIYLLYFG